MRLNYTERGVPTGLPKLFIGTQPTGLLCGDEAAFVWSLLQQCREALVAADAVVQSVEKKEGLPRTQILWSCPLMADLVNKLSALAALRAAGILEAEK